ncbi:uncharacterized protein SPSK_05947 [Sporothrix schenckii 1099-18]|uniref:Heterokaryon incompatibility domain-containing protein n=2 Tax=Sporothrix schenckii TaxID=29908 RepID=U7PR32_SPOS1|nr:uncharacterized protein SPSK_05947 [Sporothrix schenckii 1099-18]ERS98113.1 hypothetical protein HMPREF1624_04893 [Sporothrix schenckii ATCC 58251]KJR89801.1 hypothetical protein SPSK_05947 [Sporothrix schenckii 1099-18]
MPGSFSKLSGPLYSAIRARLNPKPSPSAAAEPVTAPADEAVAPLKTLSNLPSVPLDVSCYGDALCETCTQINVSKRRFFVLPDDPEHGAEDQADSEPRDLGPLVDMAKRTSCPLCRLIYVTVGGDRLPTKERGLAVHVSCSWGTTGPQDPAAPWVRTPAVRVLQLSAQTSDQKYLQEMGMFFPEITMLAADMPATPYAGTHPDAANHLVRLRKPGRIDFDRVRQWLALCRAHHGKKCRVNPLLALNALGRDHTHPADAVPEFRCVDVERMCLARVPAGTAYTALSYVWGRRAFYCTKRAAVAELEQPGALALLGDHLPPTIRDALHAARELGLAYLWIDTLCIVQDDADIKMATIGKMDLVYCAAELVLIAAGARDAYAGLAGVGGSGGRPRQAIEQMAPGFRLAANARWQDFISDSLYYTRGWTLQEDHFATRSLVFIGGTAVFRCRTADAWQEHVFEPADELRTQDGRNDDDNSDDDDDDLNDIGTMEEFMNSYSERQLSFGADLYHAFAGMARQLVVQYNTDLCHGLPTRFFDWHLLWDGGSHTHHVRCLGGGGDTRGPSWSWSGWTGGRIFAHIWDWYTRDIGMVDEAIGTRTWIVWYHRVAHDSTECVPLVRHMQGSAGSDGEEESGSGSGPAAPYHACNLYGSATQTDRRFSGLDCVQTQPTPMQLSAAYPTYVSDTLSENPGSGFLQFWTVSVLLTIDDPDNVQRSETEPDMLDGQHRRLGVFGKSGTQLGTVVVEPDWLASQEAANGGGTLPQTREFILLCEARDERAPGNGNPDRHTAGWRFKTMMLEWVTLGGDETQDSYTYKRWAQGQINAQVEGTDSDSASAAYAERVSLSSIGFDALDEALGDGPKWKEVILG